MTITGKPIYGLFGDLPSLSVGALYDPNMRLSIVHLCPGAVGPAFRLCRWRRGTFVQAAWAAVPLSPSAA